MFSSKSFIVSGLTFRSLIHFELTFVYGVNECVREFELGGFGRGPQAAADSCL